MSQLRIRLHLLREFIDFKSRRQTDLEDVRLNGGVGKFQRIVPNLTFGQLTGLVPEYSWPEQQ